jgi:uncharacterized protein DUF3572
MSADQDSPAFVRANPEALALRAFGFIGGRPSEREDFLSRCGLSAADLARRPVRPEHLVAALDFLIANEPALLAFAAVLDLTPDAAYEARRLVRGRSSAPLPSGVSRA